MSRYRLDSICSLARQLSFAPLDVRDRQITAAEGLLVSIDPGKGYPLDYITFRVTGYQPKTHETSPELFTGLALQHDLGLLVEEVSDTLSQKTSVRTEPILSIDDLTEQFNVTSKTIQRWRRRGLPARKFIFADGKKRVGFRLSIVDQFLKTHRDSVEQSANCSLVDDSEHQLILRHAKRLALICKCDVNEISRRIGRKLNRSALTIEHTLRKHDADVPNQAILTLANQAISKEDHERVIEMIGKGSTLFAAARMINRSRSAVYPIVLIGRLHQLNKRKIKFHDDTLFHQDNAELLLKDMVRAHQISASPSTESQRIPTELPPYLRDLWRYPLLSASQERSLFLIFNFYKYEFVQLRRQVDPAKMRVRDLLKLENALQLASDIKNQIIQANLRLVVSVARKHVRPGLSLMELVSEGNLSIMRAAESFDVSRGNKFSTYATLALMKGFARSVPQLLTQSRKHTGGNDILPEMAGRHDPRTDNVVMRDEIHRLLSHLNENEQRVVRAQYGLTKTNTESLASMMGVTVHRLRQIERSALEKLRLLVQQ